MRNRKGEKFGYTAALLLTALLVGGCGGGSTPPPGKTQSPTGSIDQNGMHITTDGKTSTTNGNSDKKKQEQQQPLLTNLPTKAPAEDVASSQDALFVAEGDKGVEIITIGYHDRIDHELVGSIQGINATSIHLSEDQTRLYVQNREGFVNIYDISDIKAPKRIRLTDSAALNLDPYTENGLYQFVAKQDKGFIVYDVSNPSNKTKIVTYNATPTYEIALIDRDTKALVATKSSGIDLLDISDIDHINKLGNHPLSGETLGISVNRKSGLLFVANGDKGVKVFNLNIFIDSML